MRNKEKTENNKKIDYSVEELIEMLKQKINDGTASRPQLLEIANLLGEQLPDDVTKNIDMNEVLSEEILEAYRLGGGYMDEFDKRVQDFIYVGIQMNRCFENVSRPDFDYSPIYISFCKAVEMHLNKTLVEVMKKASPDIEYHGVRLIDLPESKTLMLGEVQHIFAGATLPLKHRGIEILKSVCRQKGLTRYDKKWWKTFEKTLSDIKLYRNDCPHCSILEYDKGKNLLILLFDNYKQDPEKSFMMRCKHLYNDLK